MNYSLWPTDEPWAATAPAELVGELSEIDLFASEHMDARVTMEAPDNTRGVSALPPERRALVRKGSAPFFRRTMAHEIPWVSCQFPTPALAQEAGMSVAEFERFFYGAVLRDWDAEEERMSRLLERFDAADIVRLVGEDTDLTLSIAGRDGEVDEGKVNMPGGEFFFAPVEDSAEGTILFDLPTDFEGGAVDRIRLRFSKGRAEEARAERGEETLLAALSIDDGARFVGELGIGCNTGHHPADAQHPLRREDGRDDPHGHRARAIRTSAARTVARCTGTWSRTCERRPDRAGRRGRPGERDLADLDSPWRG